MEKGEPRYNNERRIRANRHIRELTADVILSHRDFIQPLFLDESMTDRMPLPSLNEVNSDSLKSLTGQIESDLRNGVSKFLLFPVPAKKSDRVFDFDFFAESISNLRREFGADLWIAADLCLCAYTSHGHCGVLSSDGQRVLNVETVDILSDYALRVAHAGADCMAPSDMMDGRVSAIRSALDKNGFDHVPIMSYSAKFSSQFYGPFRDACKSSPGHNEILKDRKSYQLSAFNSSAGIAAAVRDVQEGADIIMVKPALPYLDILTQLRTMVHKPLAAYHVSGEYQSLELLAAQGVIDRSKAHLEVWTSIKRAGASIIISYAARKAKQWIDEIEF